MSEAKFSDLLGKVITKIERNEKDADDRLGFTLADERKFLMYHSQDCCENVYIESITGDLGDVIGSPILLAEAVESEERPADAKCQGEQDSETWTFYKLSTIKGSVTIRWHGESNGYYSERVDFVEVVQ